MLKNLKAEMARKNVKGKDLALLLGCRVATVYDKMNGHYGFSFYEALAIKNHFFPEYDLEYLFHQEQEAEELKQLNATT
ncbi:XRE family transcriptional regulator [Pullulanibacillus sp. KACC 23026]|uniref:XRE family transcriptional regulator n=1 Tax=Pullulanibacillus sp. KACC 23026 TaxID=3028315 RepID=UPI0023AEFFC9|nr:XRE family transcriptional regulator [Pullulanibacillus sp. KACC 23026]WEG13962.1 XRE family transcriptional regulator [Pullulanibacillus sp. KACC 23026]